MAADIQVAQTATAPSPGWTLCRKIGADATGPFPDVPGGDIFGFTSGTDVGSPGDCGVAFEYSARAGKADGRYFSGSLKVQFGATIADNLAVAISPFVTHHHVSNVAGLGDIDKLGFDGLSGEISYRFIERGAGRPVAATFSMEPRWARIDGTSGEGVTAYAVEFKLFLDTVLIAERLYAALNLNYAPAMQRADNDPLGEWVKSSGTHISGALTWQISERLFVGAELRHLAAFDGAALNREVGQALFAGPTLLVNVSDSTSLNVVWTPQLWGSAAGAARRLDLDNFERHQFRVKLATSF